MWFKVDDSFYDHPKVLPLSGDEVALWLRAGAWCGRQLTDGFVPDRALPVLGYGRETADALVSVGLWERLAAGYRFHDWEDYQPTRAEVLERQARRSEAGRKGASVRWQNASDSHSTSEADRTDAVMPRPDPTRPDPKTPSLREGGTRAKRLPEGWTPNDVLRQWTAKTTPSVDIEEEVERFRDYWRGVGKPMKDWDAVWRNWARRSHEGNVRRGWRPRLDEGDEWSFR